MNTPGTSSDGSHHSLPHAGLVALAFAAIYIIWGSTYLAIRLVVESMPAFCSAGIRFVIAGALLFAFLRVRGVAVPSRSQWRHASVTGTLLLLGGNGLVVWAERSLSSGRAALLVALAPVWFATLEWLRPGGKRPEPKTVLGIIVGLFGVLALVGGRNGAPSEENTLSGALAVIVAGICWAGGSLYNKHSHAGGSHWMNAAAQMLCGGAALLVVGSLLGEPFRTEWSSITLRSTLALIYLIIFGSWIAFSAYVWLLKVSTPGKVSTYAYVNPVIAVFLGWAVLHESVTARMLWGALVILVGVIIITVPQSFFGALANRSATPLRVPSVPRASD
jgi:drug/metabolite transporter (DMT)-like permease